ncbi:hypothetical protein DDB_G0289083 [Dictyostelium discoideum AX4]|uniref:Uncharacterized protein n=1 Tax=Dictyostelium discoideum TaxID=44689 RepID=Q54I11_DICDI|nr:hypothetical protein DDB_G0289083 [Dictyostelium discoideum AX4]EAL62891.1 hypothetical protein DDB_G0289083 [Dictyostelium discoideum AX4]|eukprot:XP_636394.1 hypothetical protein DDB_G0289083 [Dictyostelium discoideum AX4]
MDYNFITTVELSLNLKKDIEGLTLSTTTSSEEIIGQYGPLVNDLEPDLKIRHACCSDSIYYYCYIISPIFILAKKLLYKLIIKIRRIVINFLCGIKFFYFFYFIHLFYGIWD